MLRSGGNIIRCPACGRTDVRRSVPHGPIDAMFLILGKKPLRCRGCEHRFYRVLAEPDPAEAPPHKDPAAP